jgi:hypothetical protein
MCYIRHMAGFRSIPVNAGGTLSLEHIIGRDIARDEVLVTLQGQSVVLTGERRMGKTSLARLIEAAAASQGWTPVRLSAEGYRSVDELADALTRRLEQLDGPLKRAATELRSRLSVNVGPIQLSGADKGSRFEDVIETALKAADDRLLLILDELPLFARAVNQSSHDPDGGTAALHLLRRLRSEHEGFRMLCLGSVGFHHVVREASGVLNDTARTQLGPLATEDGTYLAGCLLLGAGLPHDDALATRVSTAVESVPYYIHKVVQSLLQTGESATADRIDAVVESALTAPDDPWDLRHYRDRLTLYYGPGEAPVAQAVLDAIASARTPPTLSEIVQRAQLASGPDPVDDTTVRDIVERLQDDHYLVRDGDRRKFAFDLIRRAWIELRR